MLIFSCNSFFSSMKWVSWAEQTAKHNINSYETLPLLRIRNIQVAIIQKGRIAPIFKWKHLILLMRIFVLMKNIFWAGPSAAVFVLWAPLTKDIVHEDKTWIFLYEAANGCPQFNSKWNTENPLHFKRNPFIQFLFFFLAFLLKSLLTSEKRLTMESILEIISVSGGKCLVLCQVSAVDFVTPHTLQAITIKSTP